MDFLVSIAPIVVLVFLMTRRQGVPAHIGLPLVAALLYGLKLAYFGSDPNLINASVVAGLMKAWTPILIVWGAIVLFKTLRLSGSMLTIRAWVNGITTNRVAQLMIVGWAFAFMIEGASGFGTPAALAAPVLVGLGFSPVRAAVLCLIMNSVPVSFGAVGTPIWFGLSELGLSERQTMDVAFRAAIIHSVAALVIPVVALRFVVPWREVRRNLGFVFLSVVSCVAPYLVLARFNYEFPAMVGGAVGLMFSVGLAARGTGLSREEAPVDAPAPVAGRALVRASFPLWGTVLVLVVTRIQQLPIKHWLTSPTPVWQVPLGTLGTFSVSPSLVVSLKDIFGTSAGFTHELLYVPSIVPFFLIAAVSFLVLKMSRRVVSSVWSESFERMKRPILALLGALVLVQLLMVGEQDACTAIIGRELARLAGRHWQHAAAYLGAVGAFFAGSNTVSNLTFGGVQLSIANELGLNATTILSLQTVGGAMGNMVCINNIVAVCSVLGIERQEGFIIKRTVLPMLLYGVIAAMVAAVLL